MSSWLLVFALGVVWAIVLIPDFIRRNAVSRRSDTIGQFSRSLSTLARCEPAGSSRSNVVPFGRKASSALGEPALPAVARLDARTATPRPSQRGRSRAQQRRTEVLSTLIAAALLSFLASVSVGGVATTVNLVIDVLLVAYLGALLVVTRRERMRAQVGMLYSPQVRSLVNHETQLVVPAPVLLERQRVAR